MNGFSLVSARGQRLHLPRPQQDCLRVRTCRSRCSVRRNPLPQWIQIRAFARPVWGDGDGISEYLEKGRSGLLPGRLFSPSGDPKTAPPTAFSPQQLDTTHSYSIMLSKTFFPGVAVVTGAGGTGMYSKECVVGASLTPCRHWGCRGSRVSGSGMR